MSYSKEIHYRDLLIYFTYNFNKENELTLEGWQAYNRQNEEVSIPCVLESELIEKKLNKLLDEEFKLNGQKYFDDVIDFMQERRYYKNWKEGEF